MAKWCIRSNLIVFHVFGAVSVKRQPSLLNQVLQPFSPQMQITISSLPQRRREEIISQALALLPCDVYLLVSSLKIPS